MTTTSSISGSGINEGTTAHEVHALLDGRVSMVERGVEGLQASIERVEVEAREGQAKLEAKLDQQTSIILTKIDRLGSVQAASRETNWGVLIGGASVVLGIVAAIGTAWLRPVEANMAHAQAAAAEDRALLMRTFEMAVRGDERSRMGGVDRARDGRATCDTGGR